MRFLRQWIINNLGFSRKEANGTIILIFIILFSAILPRLFFIKQNANLELSTEDSLRMEEWAAEYQHLTMVSHQNQERGEAFSELSEDVVESFYFDPNEATRQELERLGFSSRATDNLISYRKKGGQFRIRSDLEKVYGISQSRIRELWNYIKLPETYPTKDKDIAAVDEHLPIEEIDIELKDLNTARPADLKEIYGIGDKLSERIVKFRNVLGGFYSLNQLEEVYGLDSDVIDKLTERFIVQAGVQKININTDSANALYRHPYIDYNLARMIINFRQQHGDYGSVEQIREIKVIDDSLYQKIYPYISIQ